MKNLVEEFERKIVIERLKKLQNDLFLILDYEYYEKYPGNTEKLIIDLKEWKMLKDVEDL